jgi:hypothetical protein
MTTLHTQEGRDLVGVPIPELTGAQVVAMVRAFEASHDCTAATWGQAFRCHDAAYYRTSALYALYQHAA